VNDFHATILHLLGFDHERLTFRHSGRDFRLTDIHGELVKGLIV
jgi:ssRNA-specific RNase YbeY (16S rRNA maturation enzyme)